MKFSKILLLIFVVVIFLAPLTAQAFDLDFDWDFDGDEQTSQNEIFNEQNLPEYAFTNLGNVG